MTGAYYSGVLKVLLTSALALMMFASCASFEETFKCMEVKDGVAYVNLCSLKQLSKKTCAIACLASVANHWGINTTETKIRSDLGKIPRQGYTLIQLRDWTRTHGLEAFIVHGTSDFLEVQTKLGRPVIVTLKYKKYNHSVVVLEVNTNGDIVCMDPSEGNTVIIQRRIFADTWNALENPALLIARGPANLEAARREISDNDLLNEIRPRE